VVDNMALTCGVDVGSGFSKAVICKDGVLLSHATVASKGDYGGAARKVTSMAAERAGVPFRDLSSIVATGYGAGTVDFAHQTASDVSCHCTGVLYFVPSARTVIDVGAQYSRAIKIDERGRVSNFVQNEKCAGGSGKFLQVVARILRMPVEEIGSLSLKSVKPVDFTTGCAVFAESEAVSRISEGALPEDILAGVHRAMAAKIVNLVTRLGLTADCAMVGGGAKDIGLVKMVELELGAQVIVPEEPQITAALGAALAVR
jgi:(R)-2-hydroxyacyl-CoA dehydratese activating ATPase